MKLHVSNILLTLVLLSSCSASDVRPPAVSGKFYSADAGKLKTAINFFLEDAITPENSFSNKESFEPVAIIVPHAGYMYSGQIAADAYRQVADQNFEIIVILGVNHTTPGFDGVSVYEKGGFQTPLGIAKIDEKTGNALTVRDKRFTFNRNVHANEHSIEVQIPFIQVVFPGVPVLPVIIGEPDPELCKDFGDRLALAIKGKKALIVASCDLSHYPDYLTANDVDKKTLESIISLDPGVFKASVHETMDFNLAGLSTCACGEAPVLTLLYTLENLGVEWAEIVSYANSGDIAVGDESRVVGYGAIIFGNGEKPSFPSPWPSIFKSVSGSKLPDRDKKGLLKLARDTIERYLKTETLPLPRGFGHEATALRGAFVTIDLNGRLRGCVGHMAEDMPLEKAVSSMALQAAFNDHRFQPLTISELNQIEIEISALVPSRKINNLNEIKLGRDGIILNKSGRSAVFLPQVAPEQGWSLVETLEQLCYKAGLPSGSWEKGAEIRVFQAEVFEERDFH